MSDDTKDRANAGSKEPYQAPRLITYGDVAQLTQNKFLGKAKDGAAKAKSRTG